MGRLKVRIPGRPVDIAFFLLLAFLCYEGHQLVRHFVGAALCGGSGSTTFTIATTRQPCFLPTIVILSGPVFTLGLAWLGMFLLRSRKDALFAYALIFASFEPLRFIQTLTGRGDELILAKEWFGITNRVIVAMIVLLLGVPPAVAAFRAIANPRRTLVFMASLLLPLPLLFVMLIGDKLLLEGGGNGIQQTSLLGISLLVLLTDLAAGALFVWLGLPHLRSEGMRAVEPQ